MDINRICGAARLLLDTSVKTVALGNVNFGSDYIHLF